MVSWLVCPPLLTPSHRLHHRRPFATDTIGAESDVATPAAPRNMATQSNLDYQTFWAPRPLSRPLCVEAQSQSHTLKPQPKSAPLPQNDKRVMIDLPKRSPYLSPRPASGRDDVIYISDDAASDINDASHEPFGETLPSIQAIMQSLEDAGEISNIGKSPTLCGQLTTATANRKVWQIIDSSNRHSARMRMKQVADQSTLRRLNRNFSMKAKG